MLKKLTVKNYALIESLEMEFFPGFSVITGETGAGKSILLGALSLILGSRADTSALKNHDEKCVVEGRFNIADFDLKPFFDTEELDYFDDCILRREISPQGRSRAFINDTPVTLTQMKALSEQLTDIHSQHQNLSLRNRNYQLYALDVFADNMALLESYGSLFGSFRKTEKELEELLQTARAEEADRDYLQFRFDELQKADLQIDEQDTLEEKQGLFEHAAEIKQSCHAVYQNLSGDDFSAVQRVTDALASLSGIEKFFPEAKPYKERLKSCEIELNDIASDLETRTEDIEYSPEEAEAVRARLDLIYGLQKKHQVETVAQLLDIQKDLSEKLSDIASYDERIHALTKERDALKDKALKTASQLHEKRVSAGSNFEQEIQKLLKRLGMPNAAFSVHLNQKQELSETGRDEAEFLFSANKNNAPAEISKVASGGEISRVMLSLKAVIAGSVNLPTIIFDEIDAGISGEIADKAGSIMQQMAQNMQVIDITHLPQIAAKADKHYVVYKSDDSEGVHTQVKVLSKHERVAEIAKMLSGETITQAAVDNAKTLLKGE